MILEQDNRKLKEAYYADIYSNESLLSALLYNKYFEKYVYGFLTSKRQQLPSSRLKSLFFYTYFQHFTINKTQVRKLYDDAMREKKDLENDAETCKRRMVAAKTLIDGLGGEKVRWTEQSKEFKAQIER